MSNSEVEWSRHSRAQYNSIYTDPYIVFVAIASLYNRTISLIEIDFL